MRKLIISLLASVALLFGAVQPASALQFAGSGFTSGLAGGWYIFYSAGGTVTHFRVKVLCSDGVWHFGNMVWTANVQSTYPCPVSVRPAKSVTAEVFYN